MHDFSTLPANAVDFANWTWEQVEPYYTELSARNLSPQTISAWLADWSHLTALVIECGARLSVAASMDTTDAAAQERYQQFFTSIAQPAGAYYEQLLQRWLESGLVAPGYERVYARLRANQRRFCAANQPLEAQVEARLGDFWKVLGEQTVEWQGQTLAIGWGSEAVRAGLSHEEGEQFWRREAARRRADREVLHQIWRELFDLRGKMAANAGYPDYFTYRWEQLGRPDYTPDDCLAFHQAIAEIAVPAASRVYKRRRAQLGVESLRPWDLVRRPPDLTPLQPFQTAAELLDGCSRILHRIEAQFGTHFDHLRTAGLLDVETRPHKMQGGFARHYAVTRQSFISLNARGQPNDVLDLIHEAGHAMSIIASHHLSFLQLSAASGEGGAEWTELTSQATTMLALPYLAASQGGFYRPAEAARAEIDYLEKEVLLFLPEAAVVDAFQHWAYTHPALGCDPLECEREWLWLEERYIPDVDWSGLEAERATNWLTHGLIFSQPLFFIEYAISLLGALQIRRNAMRDPVGALAAYQRALRLSGTGATLPELYQAAGARFALDAATLAEMVGLVEGRIVELEQLGIV